MTTQRMQDRAVRWQAVYDAALAAGRAAGQAAKPTPMRVQEHTSAGPRLVDVVPEGPCGYAWVKIRPANSPFARWLKQQQIVDRLAYGGGYEIWVDEYGQSVERKLAHARAMAAVLVLYGVDAVAQSRLD